MKNKLVVLAFAFCILIGFTFCNGKHSNLSEQTDKKSDTIISLNKNQNSNEVVANKKFNDIAHFISGIDVDSTGKYFTLTQTLAWKSYKKESSELWIRFENKKNIICKWADKEGISKLSDSIKTVFYPFSGPDFLFADLFFPHANKYILIGLEKTGRIPMPDTIKKENMHTVLNSYKIAINDIMCLSFFKTNDMKKELASEAVDGAVPVLMMFLTRAGKDIVSITPMKLNSDGNLVPVEKNDTAKLKKSIVEIIFKDRDNQQQKSLIYISADLADYALNKNKSFNKFLQSQNKSMITFLKSATYLMHKSYFSMIRSIILRQSNVVLQDDSGISYNFFPKETWEMSYYGTYTDPINMFKDYFQPKLLDDFKLHAKPLPFRIGYNSISNLMLAVKK